MTPYHYKFSGMVDIGVSEDTGPFVRITSGSNGLRRYMYFIQGDVSALSYSLMSKYIGQLVTTKFTSEFSKPMFELNGFEHIYTGPNANFKLVSVQVI